MTPIVAIWERISIRNAVIPKGEDFRPLSCDQLYCKRTVSGLHKPTRQPGATCKIAFQLLRKLRHIMAPHFSNTSGNRSHSSSLLAAAVFCRFFTNPSFTLFFLKQHKLFTVEGVSSLRPSQLCGPSPPLPRH